MSVTGNDLVLCGCACHAENDVDPQGGPIAKGTLLFFSGADLAAPDEVEVVASAPITAAIVVTGRTPAGAAVSETLHFAGEVGPKITAGQFERVSKVVLAAGSIPASVTVTVRRETDDAEILQLSGSAVSPSGAAITEVRKLFIGAAIPVDGSRVIFEKAYFLNAQATDALGQPVVRVSANPSGLFTFAIEASANGTETIPNRTVAPTGGGISPFDSAEKAFAPATLAAGDAIPVWFRLEVPSTETPQRTFVTPRLEGTTA